MKKILLICVVMIGSFPKAADIRSRDRSSGDGGEVSPYSDTAEPTRQVEPYVEQTEPSRQVRRSRHHGSVSSYSSFSLNRSYSPPSPSGGSISIAWGRIRGLGCIGNWSVHNCYHRGSPYKIHALPKYSVYDQDVITYKRPQHEYRVGFHYYESGYTTETFVYPFWRFEYHEHDTVLSPWYYYLHLPGYVSRHRVHVHGVPVRVVYDTKYTWQPGVLPHCTCDRLRDDALGLIFRAIYRKKKSSVDCHCGYALRDPYIDQTIQNLTLAFQSCNPSTLDPMISRHRSVFSEIENYPGYGVSGDDFYAGLVDVVRSTRTEAYRVEEVMKRSDGSGFALIARHCFRGPYGEFVSMFHKIDFMKESGRFVIDRFTVAKDRPPL